MTMIYLSNLELLNQFRKLNIEIKQFDDLYIDILMNHIYQNNFLNIEQISELSQRIIKYQLEQGLMTSTDFIDLFKRSKYLKGKNIDIQSKFETSRKEWEEILSQIN